MSKWLACTVFACVAACSDAHSTAEDAQLGAPAEDAQVAVAALPPVDPTAPAACEHDGRRYKFGEQFFDRARCQSRVCGQSGIWDIQSALCTEGSACDGGPCEECTMGASRFPLGTTVPCSDGCNRCTCTGYGKWLGTTAACSGLEPVMSCARAVDGDATAALYLAGDVDRALALRYEFGHGGCNPASLKACYANEALPGQAPRVRIWLDTAQPLAACTVPFVAERVFSLAPLRETFAGEHAAIELVVGSESIALEF